MVELKTLKDWEAKPGDTFIYHAGNSPTPTGYNRTVGFYSPEKRSYVDNKGDNMIDDDKYPYWSLVSRHNKPIVGGAITSSVKPDGGPSEYYDFPFQDWTTVNDMVEYLSEKSWGKHSWIFKDILKAVTRWGNKKGTEHSYDAKKIIYYGCRLLMSVTDKKTLQDYLQQLVNDKQFKDN